MKTDTLTSKASTGEAVDILARYTHTRFPLPSYPGVPRCRSGCRRCGCWAGVDAVSGRSVCPAGRRGASCTRAGHQSSRPALCWPPPPGCQAGTPDSPWLLPATRPPCRGGGGEGEEEEEEVMINTRRGLEVLVVTFRGNPHHMGIESQG